ncbi:MAG TPA: hypothetical protein VLD86_17485, partial [Ilumatobacteraceae bacterium]|nr:hypothetical protein [Ilumatobacteraceae bacterium]
MFERRLYFHIDWLLLAAIVVLAGIGLAMIYSITASPSGAPGPQFWTQLYAFLIGVGALVFCLVVDYRMLAE